MVRRKTAKAKKVSSSGTASVTIKVESVDIGPDADVTEDPIPETALKVDEPPPVVAIQPDAKSSSSQGLQDPQIRVVSLSQLKNDHPRVGNVAVTGVVKNNVSRKMKLSTMQAIYKALKRVDDEEEEENEDDDDCSEDEDGPLDEKVTSHSDTNHMHFMLGGSYEEPVSKKRNYGPSDWYDEPVSVENVKNPDWFSVKRYPAFLGDRSSFCSEVSFFSLFFDDSLIDQLVTHTNEEIKLKNTDDVQGAIGVTNPLELRAILGLLLMHGLLRKTPLQFSDLFSDAYGPPMFKATVTKAKMEFILRMMRFDDKETREDRKRIDKFAAYRDFWDTFCGNCARWYSPSEYLTVGDSFLEFGGKCPFKMRVDRKAGYAMRLISLCDARTFYFCGGIPYLGKYFVGEEGLRLPTQYVVELCDLLREPDRNVTTDEWFTSVELADELTKRKFTMVGPIKTDADVPAKLLSDSNPTQPLFAYRPDKTMVAFSLNNHKSVFISTLHKTGTLNAATGKPDIYELYDMTRRGLEIIDRNCETFSTRKPGGGWTMRFFFRTLDLAVHNSYILYQLATNTTCRRPDFIKRLALSLVEPLLQQRMFNTKLPKIVRQNVCQVMGVEPRKVVMELAIEKEAASPSPFTGRRRCWFCDSRKDRKTSKLCSNCNLPICPVHSVSVVQCQLCATNPDKLDDALETT